MRGSVGRRLVAVLVAASVATSFLVAGTSPAGAAGPPPYLGRLSTDVTMPGILRDPSGVAVASDGTVYVADPGNFRVQRFAADGTLLTSWGGRGTGDGKFEHPLGVAVDSSGNVYVTDRDLDRVQKFSATGSFLAKWGTSGSGNGQLNEPHGIAVDGSGVVYVADPGNFRVQRFNSTGTHLGSWSQTNAAWGIAADGSGNVYVTILRVGEPSQVQKRTSTGTLVTSWSVTGLFGSTSRLMIAVGANGNVYVTHPFQRVVQYTSTGTYVSSGGTPWFEPVALAVTPTGTVLITDEGGLAEHQMNGTEIRRFGTIGSGQVPGGSHPIDVDVDAAGNRYVADFGLHRILKFNAAGTLVDEWGHLGTGNGEFNLPVSVVVDSAGNVYVADTNNHRIQKFNSSGDFLLAWGSEGSANGQFSVPGGLDIDGAGNVYVADSGNDRVQKFSSNGTFLLKWGTSGTGAGQFAYAEDLTVDSAGNVAVVDGDADRVQRFSPTGTLLGSFAAVGDSIAANSVGDLFVADGEAAKIRRFTAAGALVTQWGQQGTGNGQFFTSVPIGVAVDAADEVHVADYGNRRIQEFGATSVDYRPDAKIRKAPTASDKGNNVYNTTGAQQSASATVRIGSTITYFVTVQNDSAVPDRLRLSAPSPSTAFSAKVKLGTQNITLAVLGLNQPYYVTDVLAPGQQVTVKFKVSVAFARRGQVYRGKMTVRSDGDPTVRDVVLFTTTAR